MTRAFYNYLRWTLYHSNLETVGHVSFSLFFFLITARLTQNSFSKAESLTIALLLLPVIPKAHQLDHRKSPFTQNPNKKFFCSSS
jgi:hypothetical protein